MASSSPVAENTQSSEALDPVVQHAVESLMSQLIRGKEKRKSQAEPPDGRRPEEDDVDENGKSSSKGKDYTDYGRAFARLGEPFTRISTIVQHGLTVEARDSDDERELTNDEKRLSSSWLILADRIPNFKSEMVAVAEERKLRRGICGEITKGVDCARSDDSGSLKRSIIGYLHLDTSAPLIPPISENYLNKSIRGWNHPVTAALLTPLEYPANDTTYAAIKACRTKVTAAQFPRFLYPDGREYDEDDIESGLLRGHLMIRCAKHIFVGRSCALQSAGYKKGRGGVAKIIGMQKITPRAIAYVALQVRFAISDIQEWNVSDRDFDYQVFFWNLVSLFDDGEFQDVLKFYDHELFGVSCDDPPLTDSSTNIAETPLERLKSQRAAKRARTGLSNVTGPSDGSPEASLGAGAGSSSGAGHIRSSES